jgi:glycosyltransferase involved in cell wall biosynthesis
VTAPPLVDVLIPTFSRPAALAVTLAGIAAQDYPSLRVVISDQSDPPGGIEAPEVRAIVRVLEAHGRAVELHRHLPRRGLAEHRQSLLDRTRAPYALFIDDDVWLEPGLVRRMVHAIRIAGCGFIGSAVVGLSHRDDHRPDEQRIEFWDGPVWPELVEPGTEAWQRFRLHNAANLEHLRWDRPADHDRLYRVAWVGGCVLYDVAKLRTSGGFGFWEHLPERHAGEDVLAQLRVMARFGGAGLFPSGAYHLELPTTVPDRQVDAPHALRDLVA